MRAHTWNGTGALMLIAVTGCMAVIAPTPSRGELADTFDPPNPNVVSNQLGSVPPPTIQTNGPAGNFLRLVQDGVNGQVNHYTYDRADTGAFETIDASFLFRITSADAAADGFHFLLVPTADFGTTGDGPNAQAEEPNWANTFAVGFDVHPAADVNDVSLHWDGFEHVNDRVPVAAVNLDTGLFHRAELNLRRVGNSSIAKLTLTAEVFVTSNVPHVAFESIAPMMLPYESRVQFGARTGGLNTDVDLDNVSVTVSNAYTPIASINTNRLFQDFDRAGCTFFVSGHHSTTDLTWFRPGPLPQTDGDARGVYLRLIHDGVDFCRNSIAFDYAGPSLSPIRRIAFDFRMTSGDWAADGWSVILLPTATHGVSGYGYHLDQFEEPNVPGALAVGFDLHPEDTGANDVSLHWNGVEVTNVTVDPAQFDLNNSVWNHGELIATYVGSGTVVSVVLYPDVDGGGGAAATPIDAFFIEGLLPYEHRVQFGGRTGGRYMDLDLDNITGARAFIAAVGHTEQGFDGDGTPYEVWRTPGGAAVSSALQTNGPTGSYLRLVDDAVNNHRNAVVFDQSEQGEDVRAGRFTTAQVDFRATSTDTNNPADGFGFMLIPVDQYGRSGPGAAYQTGYMGVEKPNMPGVLAVGVDLHSKAAGVNDVSLHWNSTEVRNMRLDPALIDLDSGVFHRLEVRVEWAVAGSIVTVTVTPDIHGTPGPPVEAIRETVAGVTPYDFRVELAARTGGSTVDLDVDNIHVETMSNKPGSVIVVR
jgi:hypothetical protein